ncbi:MAG: hypothetical protein AAFX94_13570 [Myxococcota bacterium]
MKRLNRCVLVVRPLAPYLEWASSVSEDDFLDEQDAEVLASAYLLPDLEDEDDAENLLAAHAARVFESELAQWNEDSSTWPEARTMETLLQWFAIDLIPLVVDVAAEELAAIPLEDDA